MKIFVSWSGERSGDLARTLKDWLPKVLQAARPWLSSASIDPGTRWASAVADALQGLNFGILCVTPESADAPWLLFEAGALSKIVSEAHVVPFLFDLQPRDLIGPLAQFQALRADKPGTLRLLVAINEAAGDRRIDSPVLQEAFEVWWPRLETALNSMAKTPPHSVPIKPMRSAEDMLGEVLDLLRPAPADFAAIPGELSETITAYLGMEISELRSQRGLTRSDLAKLAGVTEKTIARIESGVASPRLSTIAYLARPLGVGVQELIDAAALRVRGCSR